MNSFEKKDGVIGLIEKARFGNTDALDELIAKYEPLTTSLFTKYAAGFSKEDAEDMKQEMLIAFCNAVMTYDLKQEKVEFGLYAKICMERGLVSQLRTIKRRVNTEPIPESQEPYDAGEDPSRLIIESESIAAMWKLIRENLSDYENRVWNLHLSGHSTANTAEILGKDVKSIDNALCRIRAKLRKALKRQYR